VPRHRVFGNIHFLPLQPVEKLNALLNLADIYLLLQRDDAADLVMPSKLTGMLESGRPVVVTADPDMQMGKVVSGCGILTRPGDPDALAATVSLLADSPASAGRWAPRPPLRGDSSG